MFSQHAWCSGLQFLTHIDSFSTLLSLLHTTSVHCQGQLQEAQGTWLCVQVDLIHQANEQMFRYLNYVQQRLSSHIADLQGSPELMKLLRDLHVWVAREGSGRCAMPSTPSMSGSSAGKTSAATPSFRLQAARTPLMASCHSRINP